MSGDLKPWERDYPAQAVGQKPWERDYIAPPPAGGVKRGMPGVVDDPNRSAPFLGTMGANLFPNVKDQISAYAKEMNIPENKFGVVDGNVVYYDDRTGDLVRVTPSVRGSTGVFDFLRRTGQWIGKEAPGAAPQLVGGVVGAATMPTTPAGSIPAAGGAAAITDIARQSLGNLIYGKPLLGIDWMNSLGQGGLAGAGQALGVAVNKALTKNPAKLSNRDLQEVADPTNLPNYRAAQGDAQKWGIKLTPGEITGNRGLLNRQRQIGRFDETSTLLDDFYKYRNQQQVPGAFEGQFLPKISPQPSPAVGARSLQSGADDVIEKMKGARRAEGNRLYPQVVNEQNNLSDDAFLQMTVSEGNFSKTIERAIREVRTKYPDAVKGLPDNNMVVLDLAKKHLDQVAKVAERSGANLDASIAKNAARTITGATDVEFPAYQAARQAFAGKSGPIDEVQNSIVGLAGKDRATNFQQVPKIIFDAKSADPLSVAKARADFANAGMTDRWNDGLRAWLQTVSEDAKGRVLVQTQNGQGSLANRLFGSLFANERQRNILKAAMDPQQFSAFESLMKVLEMAGRQPAMGSPTATDIFAGNAFASSGAKFVGGVASGTSPLRLADVGGKIGDMITNLSSAKQKEAIAKIITSPDAITELQKLRFLKPNSQKALVIVSNLLTNVGLSEAGAKPQPVDFLPSEYRAPQ